MTSEARSASLLPDPHTRVALGAASLLLTTAMLGHKKVGRCEERIFRSVNDLPDQLFGPVWLIMQLGTLGAVPVAAAIARFSGKHTIAARLLLGGCGAWALSKLVKRVVRRPRPGALIAETRIRGREATGLGYLSGHAGVALALGLGAWPLASRSARIGTLVCVPLVGLARMYVGAHLPLDVAGGFALGFTVDALVELLINDHQ